MEVVMPVQTLKNFLDKKGVKYTTISHSVAFTAQEIAALAHIHGKELAKTVIVKTDGRMFMAVLPASYQIDLALLSEVVASPVELASEYEFQSRFPNCELGAMPPFGNLYDMEVYVDESLSEGKEIAFNAGTHKELVRLAYNDFEQLVTPVMASFAR
jgi:Ala-tRNA(Pro) deacylase